jgi:hypothetical protein
MPAATQYWDFENIDRELIQAAEDERKARYNLHGQNQAYYDGDHKKPLKVKSNVDNNVIVNLTAQAVDRMLAFLFPDMPDIEMDGNSASEDPDEQLIEDTWSANGGAVLMQNAGLMGGIDGQVYLEVTLPDPGKDYARIVVHSGANLISYWDDDDLNCVLWYEKRGKKEGKQWRQDIINLQALDAGTGWEIREYINMAGTWQVYAEPIRWEYPFGPIVDFQHMPRPGRYYGEHEFKHAKLNDAANKVASDIKAILRSHASPKTIGTGVQASAVQETAIDSFWAIPNETAKVFNLEMGSDLTSSMNFLMFLQDAYMAQSRVALLKGGPDAFKNITNLGIKAAFMDMIAKNEVLRRQYGKGIEEVNKRILMLAGRDPMRKQTLRWASALPVSQLEDAQVAQLEIDMGVLSKETAAGKLGLDWDAESERLDNEGQSFADMLNRAVQRPNPFDTPQDRARQQQGQQQIGAGNGGTNGS